jgi:uncharacterized protein (TIGR02996 family)
MTADEKGFLAALKKNPKDATARGAYADWLDEHERPYEAALQRGKAGLSEVYYKIRRKTDGLFSTGTRSSSWVPMGWSQNGKMWRKLSDLLGHMRGLVDTKTYGRTAWKDIEVVFVEVRVTYTTTLPVTKEKIRGYASRTRPTVVEPLGGGKKTEVEE